MSRFKTLLQDDDVTQDVLIVGSWSPW